MGSILMGFILMGFIPMGTHPDGDASRWGYPCGAHPGGISPAVCSHVANRWRCCTPGFQFPAPKAGLPAQSRSRSLPGRVPPRGMPWGRCPLPGLLRLGSTDLKHHKVWSREKNPRSRAGMCPVQRLLCAAASTVPEHGAAGTFVHQRHGHSRAKKIEFCFFFFAPRATCTASDSHSPASNRANVLVSWCPLCQSLPLTLLILQKKRRWKLVEKI